MRNQNLQKGFVYSWLVNLLLSWASIFVTFLFIFVLIFFLRYPTFALRVLDKKPLNFVAQLNIVAAIQPN